MKLKIISIFIILLILTISVSAFCLFGLGNCNKAVGFNPIFDEKEVGILQMLNLREVVEFKSKDIEREMPLGIIKPALPLTINGNVYDGEDFSVVITKSGKVLVFDLMNNYDVLINGNEEELKNLFMTRTNQELIFKITNLDMEANTFKGMLIAGIVENYLGVKNLIKNKSTTQKVIGVLTSSISWFR